MNSKTAKNFRFSNGWGIGEAHSALLQCGAQSKSITVEWTANHYRWIVWKFASFIRTFPDSYSPDNLSPGWILSQLIYRYEREIHLCHRSALKKIVERDDAAGKYLCLMVAVIDEASRIIELSDGWYSIWTCALDQSFWDLVADRRIHVGMKIEISGASLTGQDAISALEASSPNSPCRLVISRNSCRPARWYTKLGFVCTSNRAVAFLKELHQIHPQGGPIPAISVVIDRVYPLLYREERESFNEKATHVSRNERDHYLYLENLIPEHAQSSKFTPIQRIKVVSSKSVGIVTFWNPLGEVQRSLLQEGSRVILTNLRSKSHGNTLALVSSKSTRIFKDDSMVTESISHVKVIGLNDFRGLKDLKLNEMFDVTGISLGRVGNYFWLSGVDPVELVADNCDDSKWTLTLICLRNFPAYQTQPGDVLNIRDLTFNHFDFKVGVAHFTFTDYSDFKKVKSEEFEKYFGSMKRFRELTK